MTNRILLKEFNDLTTKFLFLNSNNDKLCYRNVHEISMLLNELNSLDYEKTNVVDPTAAIHLLGSILNISWTEDVLVMKACCLMSTLVFKQKIYLPEGQFEDTVEWLLKSLGKGSDVESISLRILSILFKNHHIFAYKILLSTEGALYNLLNTAIIPNTIKKKQMDESKEDTLANTLTCIDALLIFLTEGKVDVTCTDRKVITTLGSKIISILYNSNNLFTDGSLQFMNYLSSALSVLQKVVLQDLIWCEQNIGHLLGIGKEYFHYGFIQTSNIRPKKVLPSQQAVVDSNLTCYYHKGGKILKTRKPRTIRNKKQEVKFKDKKVNEYLNEKNFENSASLCRLEGNLVFNKTSDSDFSESESGRLQSKKHRESQIRLNAISLILAVTKNIDKKIMFGYWHCLLPFEEENPKELNKHFYGIFSCSVKDPNPKCRLNALQIILQLLSGSKIFLMQAENSESSPSSFTPFSITLGNTIVSMYESLTFAAESENSLPVLTQVLKCLALIVQVTPFSRLKRGFVTRCIQRMRSLVCHKDPTIQVAVLMVMELFISTPEITTEICGSVGMPNIQTKIIKNENKLNDLGSDEVFDIEYFNEIDPYDTEVFENSTENTMNFKVLVKTNYQKPWLLEKIIKLLKHNNPNNYTISSLVSTSIPVRIGCLKVLTAMASHILFLKDHLELVSNVLKICLKDEQNEIRLHSAKCLDTLGHSINTFLLSKCASSNEILNCQNFWTSILSNVIEIIQDSKQNSALKSILCDFLSNIGIHIFERSSHSQKMVLISLLTGISYNEDSTVRASAVRALAMYVMFPSLRDDVCFVENTGSSIVELLKVKNTFVRIKSSWSLGNISDALVPFSNDCKLDRVSDELLKKMFEISIELANENDKVKCNVVRTMGNLLRLVRPDLLVSIDWRNLCFRAIEKLIYCLLKSSSAKVKWNACYAIGNFMKNNILFTIYEDFNWQKIVFTAICNVVICNPNFKVRINGVTALTAINERGHYGSFFILLWSSLLTSMEQSENLGDFNEYKHRDNLQEQLCFALSHFIKIATKDDFLEMKINLTNSEAIKLTWKRVINRIIPENASHLINSSLHLKSILLKNYDLNIEQRNAVSSLLDCFISPEVFI